MKISTKHTSFDSVVSLDLTAAIGFKRHIQVLNYMVSNWTEIPVPERTMVKPEWDLDTGTNCDKYFCEHIFH